MKSTNTTPQKSGQTTRAPSYHRPWPARRGPGQAVKGEWTCGSRPARWRGAGHSPLTAGQLALPPPPAPRRSWWLVRRGEDLPRTPSGRRGAGRALRTVGHSHGRQRGQRNCESLDAVLGIAGRLRRRCLGMTRNGSGTFGLPWLRVVCRGAGVGLAPPLLAWYSSLSVHGRDSSQVCRAVFPQAGTRLSPLGGVHDRAGRPGSGRRHRRRHPPRHPDRRGGTASSTALHTVAVAGPGRRPYNRRCCVCADGGRLNSRPPPRIGWPRPARRMRPPPARRWTPRRPTRSALSGRSA